VSKAVYLVMIINHCWVSATQLASLILAPRVVRQLDWIDCFWPVDRRVRGGDYPNVQKYVLCGMQGSYTDFHVDFGGTSVW
jgi:F-box and leucine-rich repeat protein 10/11